MVCHDGEVFHADRFEQVFVGAVSVEEAWISFGMGYQVNF